GAAVLVDGEPVTLDNPLHAQTHGIGTAYQEVNLLPNRSVAENLYLGRQPTRSGLVDHRPTAADARGLPTPYGLALDPGSDLASPSVADHLYPGHQPTRFGLVDHRQMEADARVLLTRYGLALDPGSELGSHSVAVQQIVAIARAVALSGKVLILDEPTASLDR